MLNISQIFKKIGKKSLEKNPLYNLNYQSLENLQDFLIDQLWKEIVNIYNSQEISSYYKGRIDLLMQIILTVGRVLDDIRKSGRFIK